MDSELIKIDFTAKQVIETSNYSVEEVHNALTVLKGFLQDDLKQKELDINNALQIMDHDLEDMSDEEINSCDATAILKRRRSLRVNRRKIKEAQELQNKLKNIIVTSKIVDAEHMTGQHEDKCDRGSCDKFFNGSINRPSLKNKNLLKNSRIKETCV